MNEISPTATRHITRRESHGASATEFDVRVGFAEQRSRVKTAQNRFDAAYAMLNCDDTPSDSTARARQERYLHEKRRLQHELWMLRHSAGLPD